MVGVLRQRRGAAASEPRRRRYFDGFHCGDGAEQRDIQGEASASTEKRTGMFFIWGFPCFCFLPFQPILAKRTKIPFPIELIVVIFGTVAARGLNLNEAYNVTTVGDIPAGYVRRSRDRNRKATFSRRGKFVVPILLYAGRPRLPTRR